MQQGQCFSKQRLALARPNVAHVKDRSVADEWLYLLVEVSVVPNETGQYQRLSGLTGV
ncbi:hypothetical protein GCM10023091_36450 [Ravibacter arvi]|uniref:Uncharacterized protein n=1 Tax=Ravibacter arvi TaxID=2051041 RepID=A0ABP8M8L6_9BACT